MKTLYLIRHGDVENPDRILYPANLPLSEQGVHAVKALGEQLREIGLNPLRIVASPHVRTRETAEIIAQAIDGQVETDERLVEWKVGDWIGKPLAEFHEAAGYNDPAPFHLKLDDIENFDQISTRMLAVIMNELTKLPENGMSMLVSHREPIASAILKLRGEIDWRNIPLLDIPKPCAWKLTFDGMALIEASKAFDTSDVN
jgi:broad specificity phosphatase PhoE